MELNKGFEFTLKTTKEVKLLYKLGNKIYSKDTSLIYYMGGLNIRKNKNILLTYLHSSGFRILMIDVNYVKVGEYQNLFEKEYINSVKDVSELFI